MTITPEQIVLAVEAQVQSFQPGGVVSFSVWAADELQPLRDYLRQRGGNMPVRLLVLTEEDDTPAPPAEGPHTAAADALRASGFLADLRVAEALGSDADYHEWVSYQPSIVSGRFNEADDAGELRNVPCHVLRADGVPTRAGAHPNKPGFVQVPMTDDEHSRQHQGGEIAVYLRWARLAGITVKPSRAAAHAWFDERLVETRARWVEERLCAALEVPALSYLDTAAIQCWAIRHSVEDLAPHVTATSVPA